jgi:sporulation and spore germination protein
MDNSRIEARQGGVNFKKIAVVISLISLFIIGVAGGYLYFSRVISKEKTASDGNAGLQGAEDLFSLRLYYPVDNHLQIEERRLPKRTGQMAMAEVTIDEYFKGWAGTAASNIPKDVKLLGLYKGEDRILYVDLSDEFRRNFQGDAITEFFLLKGLYESIISNVEDVQDVKVLIEGKEAETLGGHLYLLYPLKDMVSYEYK